MHDNRATIRGREYIVGAQGITPNPRNPVSVLDGVRGIPL
jgi:hypothetical protein